MQTASNPHSESEAPVTGPQSDAADQAVAVPAAPVREIGGRRDGPEPTRYGDWEKAGRCIDF